MTGTLCGPMEKVSWGSRMEIRLHSTICCRDDLLARLVSIEGGMGKGDFDLLKFICCDYIGVSKLEKMSSSLDIFCELMQQKLVTPEDVNFLVECLGLIHRYDLISKLGFDDIDSIKSQLPRFNRISGFRKLLLEVAEDLDESELRKLKFLLGANIPKRCLQESKTVLDLFIIMEKQHLLAHLKTKPLVYILRAIKRADLVCKIEEYSGFWFWAVLVVVTSSVFMYGLVCLGFYSSIHYGSESSTKL